MKVNKFMQPEKHINCKSGILFGLINIRSYLHLNHLVLPFEDFEVISSDSTKILSTKECLKQQETGV